MTDLLVTLVFLAWWLFGVIGFVLWHTRQCDFKVEHVGIAGIMGFLAPIPWLFLMFEIAEERQKTRGPILRKSG